MSTVRSSTVRLCCIAVLAALLILMALTPLGYIPIGPLRLTLLMLPVAVGGAVLGPRAGLVLGTVFGLTSFFTCFGMDPFGAVLLGISPLRTAVMCIVPRMLAGLLPALLCRLIRQRSAGRAVGVAATALSCALTAALNTLFFLGTLWLLFGSALANDAQVTALLGGAVTTFAAVLVGLAGVNAIVEVAVNLIAGTAISAALQKALAGKL